MYPSTQYQMHWEEYNGTTLVNTGSQSVVHHRSGAVQLHAPYL